MKERDEPEPVIFYRYTGNTTAEKYEDFLMRVVPSTGDDGYDTAKEIRDRKIKEGKNK